VYVYLISAVAAVGGFLFGYDLSIVSAAVIFLKSQFSLIAVQVGFAVSSATIGCICGLLFGGMIVARIGRNKTLALTAAIYGIGAVGSALPSNMVEFDAFRILGGVGVGIASVVFLMYIAEVPPACMRGLLVTINQVAVVSGALSSIIVGYFLAASGNWRAMFASAAIPVLAIIDWTDLYSREPALVDGSRGR